MGRFKAIFDVVCFLLASYMTVIIIGRYREDKNATTITYKKFTETVEDQYPTFSICFTGDELYQYNDSAIYEAYGLNHNNYQKMVKGKNAFQYQYDLSRKMYRRIFVPPGYKIDTKFADIQLVQTTYPMLDYIKRTSFIAGNPAYNVFYKDQNANLNGVSVEKPPFYIGLQTHERICLTRESNYSHNVIRIHDKLTFDLDNLGALKGAVEIFVHYPGHLLKNLESPSWTHPDQQSLMRQNLVFKVSQSTMIRKRSTQKQPCNNNIDNYDRYLKEVVINETGCVPPFWMAEAKTLPNIKKCSTPAELKKAHDLLNATTDIFTEYQPPCLDMFNTLSLSLMKRYDDVSNRKEYVTIELWYADKYYQEINQSQDFGIQDFISNLGGFIGIFLGYSMMQIPALLGNLNKNIILPAQTKLFINLDY